MRKDFFRQDRGLLVIPDGYDKFHVSWSLDNVIEGFRYFYKQHNRYPMTQDLDKCDYLPNVKTLQRKFKGIISIRKLLGIQENDLRVGKYRSESSSKVGQRGFNAEQSLFTELVNTFHEPYVHAQSRVVVGDKRLKVDFVVYHKSGKFAVDVFYPEKDRIHFSSNVSIKYKVYDDFPFLIYLVVGNALISQTEIQSNTTGAKNKRNKNVILIGLTQFKKTIGQYLSLTDPYIGRVG